MYHHPGGYTHKYPSSYTPSQGYPSNPYAAQAQIVPYHTAAPVSQPLQQTSPTASQASSSSSKHAKRPRSEAMSRLPELPQAIYKIAAAHSSLEPAFDPDYGDSKWMEAIGRMVLPAVIAEVISTKRPLAENIKGEVDKRLESDTLAEWCTQCELRAHVHCVPTFKESLNDPDVSCDILYTFVGAVHAASGVDGVRSWLGRLIDPAYEENNENAFKRAKIEPMTNGFSSQPPPPTSQPPPPPTSAPPPVPSGPSNSSVSLSYLNQVASQRRINVAWNTNMSGPSHNPQWTAECVLNGIVKGTGIAQSKQAAKEQAARSTVHMMGF